MTWPSVSDETGVTLVELLVAVLAGVVVIFALLSILTGTLRLTQRTFTRVDATRQGRNAIANLENELHSACLGAGPPIQAGSSPTVLQFIGSTGSAAVPTPVYHVVTYSTSAQTLVDNSYTVTGTAPNFAPGTQLSSNQLLSNVSQRVLSGNTVPVFQYFAYSSGSTDAGGTYWFVKDGFTTDPGSPAGTAPFAPLTATNGLSSADASNTVEVLINLSVGATSESLNSQSLVAVNDQVADAISLRLTTPPDEYAGTVTSGVPPGYGPCT